MQGKYLSLQPLFRWGQEERLFLRDAPLVLEIGFGNGEYLLQQSGLRPECDFLGLELHWGSLRRALRRIHQQGRENIRVAQIDANIALRYLIAPASLEEFCALFPCPWPKRDHTHHRLFSHDFLKFLNRALVPRGTGLIVTDHARFRDFVLSQVGGSGFIVVCHTVPALYNTKYERRWTSQGQQEFYELRFTKVEETGAATEEVILKSRQVVTIPADGPQPQGVRGPICVEFKRRLFDAQEQIYMFLVVVNEEGLTQTLWVEVQFRDSKNCWAIRLAPGTGALPTAGVQKAVDLVYEACLKAG